MHPGALWQTTWTPPRPDHWWRFEDNVLASAGDYDGTPIGTPTYTSGQAGRAIVLNGTSQRVDLSSEIASVVLEGKAAATVCVWVRQDALSTTHKTIFGVPVGDSTGVGLWLYADAGSVYAGARSRSADTFQTVSASSAITATTWHHLAVAVNWTAKTMKIYGDGEELQGASSLAFGVNVYTPTSPLELARIGMPPGITSSRYWNGRIDEFMLYTRELSAAEIKSVYRRFA